MLTARTGKLCSCLPKSLFPPPPPPPPLFVRLAFLLPLSFMLIRPHFVLVARCGSGCVICHFKNHTARNFIRVRPKGPRHTMRPGGSGWASCTPLGTTPAAAATECVEWENDKRDNMKCLAGWLAGHRVSLGLLVS